MGLADIKTYRQASLERDFSLHLFWDSERLEPNGSAPGLPLAQALKKSGRVDHSGWDEDRTFLGCLEKVFSQSLPFHRQRFHSSSDEKGRLLFPCKKGRDTLESPQTAVP